MSPQRGDHPISSHTDDELNRQPAAMAFAVQVMELDTSQGLVVGVIGEWGSGKTSFVNLARPKLYEGASAIVDFNPWMFSGTDQLVDSFFIEISAQLKVDQRLSGIADELSDYGDAFTKLAWLPVAGSWLARLGTGAGALGKLLQKRKNGIAAVRAELSERLSALDQPIMVVVDDIDRLDTAEIRYMFKLVRLTAAFPNIVYILAFDRVRVERALAEDNIPGRAYLEKILQLAVDLPQIPDEVLLRQLLRAINESLSAIDDTGPFHEGHWPDIVAEILLPLVANMRDVRRLAASLPGAVRSCKGQVALADLIALEAVRVLRPDIMAQISAAGGALTTPWSWSSGGASADEAAHQAQISQLIDEAGDDSEVVTSMIERLFPAGQRFIGGSSYGPDWLSTWLKERRVAHGDVLRVYLERVLTEPVAAFAIAESLFHVLDDRVQASRTLEALSPELLEGVIRSLEAFENDFEARHVVPGCIALLNNMDRLPETSGGMFEIDKRFTVTRVVLRLLRTLKSPDSILTATREALLGVASLTAQFELVSMVGHRENAGHKLVNESGALELEREWRDRLRTAPAARLGEESDLLRIVSIATGELDDAEDALTMPDDPAVTAALIKSAYTEVQSRSVGSRAVRREGRLHWDSLVASVGSEAELRRRADALGDGSIEESLAKLLKKYLNGWRPEND